MIFQGVKDYIRGKSGQTIYKLALRLVVWGGMLTIGIYPNVTVLAAKTLGIIENINAVVLVGFLLVFLMIFKLLSAIERLEQDISAITRKEALKEIKIK
jgi:hypothetical protein